VPVVAPFSLGDVASQAERAAGILRAVESRLAADEVTGQVADRLPAVVRDVDARAAETNRLVQSPSLEALRAQEEGWAPIADTLSAWRKQLSAWAGQLERDYQRFTQLDEMWQRMQAFVSAAPGAPPEVAQRVEASATSVRRTHDWVEQRRSQVLTLQNRVAAQEERAKAALALLRDARGEAAYRLLSQDSPPIWRPAAGKKSTQDALVAQGQQSFQAEVAALQTYMTDKRDAMAAHLAVFVLLIAVCYWVRRRMSALAEEDQTLRRAASVFDYPVATALLLALLLSGWFYPHAPRLMWAVLMTVVLFPTVLILRRLLHPTLYPVLNLLVVCFAVDQFRMALASWPLLGRLLLIAEMLGAAAFLAWFIRSGRLAVALGAGHDRLGRAALAAARLVILLFAMAFFAGAAGYMNLARQVARVTLGSAYLAMILYAATRVLDGLTMSAYRSRPLASLAMVQRERNLFWNRTRRVLHWAAAAVWVLAVLETTGVRGVVFDYAGRVLSARLGWGNYALSLGGIIQFALAIWAAVLLSRFIRFLLEEDVYPRLQLAAGLPYAISTALHYAVLLIGFFVAIDALGYDMTRFAILAGAFGVGLGFGLQNIFNNFVSGLILLFERPVKVGDVVQVGDTAGVVRRIGIRASVVRTPTGAEIIMPNGRLISDPVTNWTLSGRQRRVDLPLTVAPGTDPKRVIELWRKVANDHPKTSETPEPRAFLTAVGANGLSFELQAWVSEIGDWAEVRSDLAIALAGALTEAGIGVR
jgi:potassium-dependent mechanosensitive channel